MSRLRGRALRGQRCKAIVPFGHWNTTTFIAGLRVNGLTAPLVLEGPINGESFIAYVEQILAPTLSKGDVVIMDNLSTHKSIHARNAIEQQGAHVLFLPPYSPDMNPIDCACCAIGSSNISRHSRNLKPTSGVSLQERSNKSTTPPKILSTLLNPMNAIISSKLNYTLDRF